MSRLVLYLLVAGLVLLTAIIPKAFSADINVSLKVGDTTITLSGKTSPSSQVTFSENDAIVGTTTSDSLGNFTKTLEDQNAGLHEFQVYSTDPSSTPTAVTTVSLSATEFSNTEVQNIVLPSTLYVSDTQIEEGESISLSGYGVPNSTIRVFVSTIADFSTTTTDADGYWTYTIDTTTFDAGSHNIHVVLVTPSNYTSLSSTTLTITVAAQDQGQDEDDDDDDDDDEDDSDTGDKKTKDDATIIDKVTTFIRQEAEDTKDKVLESILYYFDIDKSGKIELTELDLVIRRWLLEVKGGSGIRCDLNFDTKCNIIDFSILLYYIER